VQETWQEEDFDVINKIPSNLDWVREWTIDFDFEYLIFYACVMMMISVMNFIYKELLILLFLVDVGMVNLSNPTHMSSKWVIQRYDIDEGEEW